MKKKVKKTSVWVALLFASVSASPVMSQTAISYGQYRLGAIGCPNGTATYRFTAQAGDYVVAHVIERSDHGGVCCGVAACRFDQCITLLDSNGSQVTENCSPIEVNNCGHFLRTKIGPVQLSTAGSYDIVIRDVDNCGRGDFTVYLQCTNSPGLATLLTDGSSQLDIINAGGEVRTFVVELGAGDRILFDMLPQQGNINPRLEMYMPQGTLEALPGNGTIDQVVTSSGFFTVLAFSAIQETGTFLAEVDVNEAGGYAYCIAASNSVGSGAFMAFAGDRSISTKNFTLLADGCPPSQPGLFFYGGSQVELPFGNGYRCVGGQIFRFPPVSTGSLGIAAHKVDFDNPPHFNGYILPGSSWNFQFWYRDPQAGGAGFNLSNGLAVTFVP